MKNKNRPCWAWMLHFNHKREVAQAISLIHRQTAIHTFVSIFNSQELRQVLAQSGEVFHDHKVCFTAQSYSFLSKDSLLCFVSWKQSREQQKWFQRFRLSPTVLIVLTGIPLCYWELALCQYAWQRNDNNSINCFSDTDNHQLRRYATPVGRQDLFLVPCSQECSL